MALSIGVLVLLLCMRAGRSMEGMLWSSMLEVKRGAAKPGMLVVVVPAGDGSVEALQLRCRSRY